MSSSWMQTYLGHWRLLSNLRPSNASAAPAGLPRSHRPARGSPCDRQVSGPPPHPPVPTPGGSATLTMSGPSPLLGAEAAGLVSTAVDEAVAGAGGASAAALTSLTALLTCHAVGDDGGAGAGAGGSRGGFEEPVQAVVDEVLPVVLDRFVARGGLPTEARVAAVGLLQGVVAADPWRYGVVGTFWRGGGVGRGGGGCGRCGSGSGRS